MMLRPTEFEPLTDVREEEAPGRRVLVSNGRARRAAFVIRQRLGHMLISVGRIVAADPPAPRSSQQRRRAF